MQKLSVFPRSRLWLGSAWVPAVVSVRAPEEGRLPKPVSPESWPHHDIYGNAHLLLFPSRLLGTSGDVGSWRPLRPPVLCTGKDCRQQWYTRCREGVSTPAAGPVGEQGHVSAGSGHRLGDRRRAPTGLQSLFPLTWSPHCP